MPKQKLVFLAVFVLILSGFFHHANAQQVKKDSHLMTEDEFGRNIGLPGGLPGEVPLNLQDFLLDLARTADAAGVKFVSNAQWDKLLCSDRWEDFKIDKSGFPFR